MRQLPTIRDVSLSCALFLPSQLSGFVAEFNPSRSLATGNLWQNTAKTVAATAHNDPVRVLRCPLSGVEWTAPSDAARALLKISGMYSWIELDGSDDAYDSTETVSSLGISSNMTCGVAVSFSSGGGYQRVVGAWGGSNDSFILSRQFGSPFRMSFELKTTTTSIIADTVNITTNEIYQFIATHTSGSQVLYRNGNSVATGSLAGSLAGTNNITVGRSDDGGLMTGRIGGIVFYSRVLPTAEISILNTYLSGLLI